MTGDNREGMPPGPERGRKPARIYDLGISKTLCPYLLQLASSTSQAQRSSNECPA